ncbi:MAG TPA: hypothetical protein VFV19_00820 [Candidatus Polarisedimenticolaceae bacterium]|nr:hypothetical protein [Candidatus Polarisedimenticolaceae bacterium]
MGRFFGSILLVAAAAAAPSPSPAPVHSDAKGLERGVLDATKGLMFGDFTAARAALDKVEAGCRHLGYDEPNAWPHAMVDEDVAMHAALSHAREFASRKDWENASNSLIWIERCCKDCHALRATSANPADTGNPTLKTSPRP